MSQQLLDRIQQQASNRLELAEARKAEQEARAKRRELSCTVARSNHVSQDLAKSIVSRLDYNYNQSDVQGGVLGVFKVVSPSCRIEEHNDYRAALNEFNHSMEKLCKAKRAVLRRAADTGEGLNSIRLDDMALLKKLDRSLWKSLQNDQK